MQKIILKLGIKIIEVSMNKYNLEELKKQTLINILSAKGLYYQKYQRLYQQKHQSYRYDYLPIEQLK